MAIHAIRREVQGLVESTGVQGYLHELGEVSPDTLSHCEEVSDLTILTADKLLQLPEDQIAKLGYCALLHDIGKVDEEIARIVGLPRQLDENEARIVARHSYIGAGILNSVADQNSGNIAELLRTAAYIAYNHHNPMRLSTNDGKATAFVSVIDRTQSIYSGDRPYPRYGIQSERPELTTDIFKVEDIAENGGTPIIYGVDGLELAISAHDHMLCVSA